jgi:methylenetetrahydrofolate reductase (NADPH)
LRIAPLYVRPVKTVSFEFFPPKTPEAEQALFEQTVPALKTLAPSFCSVTYGAGGSTRDRTLRIVGRIKHDYGVEAMLHLTCVGSTRAMLAGVLDEAEGLGIENIIALRGDPPKGQTEFKPVEGGFAYALELVKFIKARGGFGIAVAGYPEGHVECKDRRLDWDRCAAKVEAGGEVVITQLFYDAEDFFAFEDYLRHRRGVKVPIVPGVLPFLSTEQIRRFTSLCGSKIPPAMAARLEQLGADDESVRKYGVELCTELCARLSAHGVPGFHFYCLNRSASVTEIMRNLKLAPAGA